MQDRADQGSASNHYLTALYHAACLQGLDAKQLLMQVGLSEELVGQPDARLPATRLAAFQKAIWDTMGDESMGLCATPLPLGSYLMMGRLVVHQPTLGKALALGARFYNMLTQSPLITLVTEGENTVLRVNLSEPERDYQHLFAEITLLAWHRLASWLVADALPLTETRFPYPAPSHVNEYNYLYPGRHQFLAGELSLVFPTVLLQRQVCQNDASLKAFMQACPLELFRRYRTDYSISAQLALLLQADLLEGSLALENAAERLHLTPRTLMRRLKEEGTSFQQLKDIVRRDKAMGLLKRDGLAIKEVAELLGFSDPAVFTRAFRSWTGESPSRYRNKCLAKHAQTEV